MIECEIDSCDMIVCDHGDVVGVEECQYYSRMMQSSCHHVVILMVVTAQERRINHCPCKTLQHKHSTSLHIISFNFLVLRSQAHNYSTSLSYIILPTCCFFGVKLRNISHHIMSYIILLTNNLLLLGSQAQEYTVSHKK